MKKLSRLTKVSILLAIFFALDKGLGILRQVIIGRQFGISPELDVFNAANNLPDMLFALISGGALAIAFIPVLTENITQKGKLAGWKLFSQIANLAFIVTAVFAVLFGVFARPLVSHQLGIAPGFSFEQQQLTVQLLRMNLVATLIFSVSGLVMAGLQANQHFLYPALAPLIFDVGQIFGALILAPAEGYQIGSIKLPAFGMGVQGLVWGVIIGAALHLLIQVPGLIKHQFKWYALINLSDPEVRKVIKLMGPRILSMLFIQIIFLARDNLASRLPTGAITSLTYGWWIMQVPETLIGTAIATALLPTLAALISEQNWQALRDMINKAMQAMIALSIPISVILAFTIQPWIQMAFNFDDAGVISVVLTTQGFLVGLLGHSLVEVGVRIYYARQKPLIPLILAGVTLILDVGLSLLLMQRLEAAGISLANSIAYSVQAIVLFILIGKWLPDGIKWVGTAWRSLLAGGIACAVVLGIGLLMGRDTLIGSMLAMVLAAGVAWLPIKAELKLLMKL